MEEIARQSVLEKQLMTSDTHPANGPGADVHQRLKKACADFEAIFVQQLFKTMRESVPESNLMGGGRAEELYTSMLDQQVSEQMAHGQGSIGLANQMQTKLAHYLVTGTVTKSK